MERERGRGGEGERWGEEERRRGGEEERRRGGEGGRGGTHAVSEGPSEVGDVHAAPRVHRQYSEVEAVGPQCQTRLRTRHKKNV